LCYPWSMEPKSNNCRLEIGILISYFFISLLILFPLFPHMFSKLPFASNGDIRLSLTILFSNLKKLSQGDLLNIFQLPILFPLSHTLTAGINLFGQTLLVLPFYLIHIRNIYFIYNFLTFFAYIAAGYCAYFFVREFVRERWIAWVIGALYILMPYRVHNIPQLNLMFSFPIPLTLLFFSRFLKNSRMKDLVFFFFSFLIQFLFDLSMGIFLGIALLIYFLARQILTGFSSKRIWFFLAAASILFVLLLGLIFFPYLNQKISFSMLSEVKALPTYSFHSPLNFYSNWSYLLRFFNRIIWLYSPFSPGISIFIFFLLAFSPYLENRLQKISAFIGMSLLILPAMALPFVFKSFQFSQLNLVFGWTLLLFLLNLTLLLFLIRKKIPRELLVLTTTWIILQFYSSQISLHFFNLFQGLAQVLPFLLRARYIRTEYILQLLFITISAFGFSYFFNRFREKKLILALVLFLVFAERIRWPVYPEKLNNDRPVYRTLYQHLALYPDHFGLLELPFYPLNSNHYSLFTIYHDKHTYHGLINYLSDYYKLNGNPQLNFRNNFSGLSDPQFIQMLKTKGIRLIILFKDKVQNEDLVAWHEIQNQVRQGENKGLFEKTEKTKNGILLVLNEREQGPRIRYFLPHYSLMGKKSIVCTINANQETEVELRFNDKPVKKQRLQNGIQNSIVIGLEELSVDMQFNTLEFRSGPSLELIKVRIE
jgi:hypothetical protein